MRLTLNEQPFSPPDETATLGEMLDRLSTTLSRQGRYLSEIQVDGKSLLDTPEDESLRQLPWRQFQSIEIRAEGVNEAVRRGLTAVSRHLALLRQIARTASLAVLEETPDLVWEKLIVTAEVLVELVRFLGLCAQHLGDQRGFLLRDHLVDLCNRVETAHQQHDVAAVIRFLQIELPQTITELETWAERLQTTLDTAG